jgi:hypothetical protein
MQRALAAVMAVMAATGLAGNAALAQGAAATSQSAAQPAAGASKLDHAGHGHDHGMAYVEPTTYAQAMRLIGTRLSYIESMAAAGLWDETHADTDAIAAAGRVLGRLALAKDSGVARAAVKDVNVGGKALAEAATAMHDALHEGKIDEGKKRFERLRTVYAEIAKAAPAAYTLSVTPKGEVTAGAPVTLLLELLDPAGARVTDLQIAHEQSVHVMLVSRDQSWYRHEHPERLADGTFRLQVTPPRAGEYLVLADFTPAPKAGASAGPGNQVGRATLVAKGETPPAPVSEAAWTIDTAVVKQAAGLDVRIRCNGGYHSREETALRFNFQRGGEDVTNIEPYLGAPAHLVIFSRDGTQYIHAHPVTKNDGPEAAALVQKAIDYGNGKPTDLVFSASFPMSGLYRTFLEFKYAGTVHLVPFTLEVLPQDAEHAHDESMGDAPVNMPKK